MKHKAPLGPKPFKAFRDKYLAVAMMVAALYITSVVSAQTDSAKYSRISGYGFTYKRWGADSILMVPLSTSPHIPYRAGGIRYNKSDSTLQLWTGSQWRSIVTGGSGIDTAYALNDSTIAIETPNQDFFVVLKGQNISNTSLTANGDYQQDWAQHWFFLNNLKALDMNSNRADPNHPNNNKVFRFYSDSTADDYPLQLAWGLKDVNNSTTDSVHGELYSQLASTSLVHWGHGGGRYSEIDLRGNVIDPSIDMYAASETKNSYLSIGSTTYINPNDSLKIKAIPATTAPKLLGFRDISGNVGTVVAMDIPTATPSRFGLPGEDELGIADRYMNMQNHDFMIDSASGIIFNGRIGTYNGNLTLSNGAILRSFYTDWSMQHGITVFPEYIGFSTGVSNRPPKLWVQASDSLYTNSPDAVWVTKNDTMKVVPIDSFAAIIGAGGIDTFGLQDNLGVRDRYMNMQNHDFTIDSLRYFYLNASEGDIKPLFSLQGGVNLQTIDASTGETQAIGVYPDQIQISAIYTDRAAKVVFNQSDSLHTSTPTTIMAFENDTVKNVSISDLSALVGGGVTPGGSNTQIQYNNSGSFAGDAGLTYNSTQNKITTDSIRSIKNTPDTVHIGAFESDKLDTAIFMGTSITAGTAASPTENRYTSLVAATLRVAENNQGLGGYLLQHSPGWPLTNTFKDVYTTIIPTKRAGTRYLFFAWGENDATNDQSYHTLFGVDTSYFKRDYGIVINYALSNGWSLSDIVIISPFWQLTTSASDSVQQNYFNASRNFADSMGIKFVDVWHQGKYYNNKILVDYIHPSNYGHQLHAEAIFSQLSQPLQIKTGENLVNAGTTVLNKTFYFGKDTAITGYQLAAINPDGIITRVPSERYLLLDNTNAPIQSGNGSVLGNLNAGKGVRPMGAGSWTTGAGLEIYYQSGDGYLMPFDRDASTGGNIYLGGQRTIVGSGSPFTPFTKLYVIGRAHAEGLYSSNGGDILYNTNTNKTTLNLLVSGDSVGHITTFGPAGSGGYYRTAINGNTTQPVVIGTLADNGSGARLQVNGNASVTDDAYDATTWNGNNAVPTKNAIRDKLESMNIVPLIYTALLNQSSTSAPSATVLGSNTIGSIVWARISAGLYTGTLSGAFVSGKTFLVFHPIHVPGATSSDNYISVARTSANAITITTDSGDISAGLSPTDGLLTDYSIEIRVYP
jgi:lysophospholipase L1-like esterase